jgi:hypothetical protein
VYCVKITTDSRLASASSRSVPELLELAVGPGLAELAELAEGVRHVPDILGLDRIELVRRRR